MYERTVLDNGLRVLTGPMPHAKSVTLMLLVGTGSRYEQPPEMGISHLLEHMCFKGTERRPHPRDISEAIEGVGGVLNASTDREVTLYWCKVPQPHFHTALDLLADMTGRSLLAPEQVDKERQVVLEELSLSYDFPTARVDVLIDEMLWPDQPMGRDVGGTRDSVKGITRDMMVEYLQRQYVPSNVVLAVAGGISHQQVMEAASLLLGAWRDAPPSPWFPAVSGEPGTRVRVEERPTEQAHLCLGLPGVPADHADRYAVNLLSTLLGEGMSSRLFQRIREELGLAYDIHSDASHFRDTGSLVVYAGVDPSNIKPAISAIIQELGQLKAGIPSEELSKAKEMSKGRLALRLEDSRGIAAFLGGQELLLGRVRTVDELLQRIDAVTQEDIQRVASQLLTRERLNLAVVGPFNSEEGFHDLLQLD